MEQFKKVKGYEGIYEISNLGNVKNLKRKVRASRNGVLGYRTVRERILKNGKRGDYLNVTLSKNGITETIILHKLMAVTFLNHQPEKTNLVIDHIDNNPLNNNLENLQIITHRENLSKDKKGTKGKYTGVSYHKKSEKWRSRISVNGKRISLGLHNTREEARDVYLLKLNEIE